MGNIMKLKFYHKDCGMTEPITLSDLFERTTQFNFTNGGYLLDYEIDFDDLTVLLWTGMRDKHNNDIYLEWVV
jgi:hypothetical protein